MLLNFNAPQLAPNIVTALQPAVDKNAILGLIPSQYEGLQSVGNTGYYYGNNRMYEPYTITQSSPSYGYGYGKGGGSNRAEGTVEIGNQAFRPVDVDVTGFTKTKGENDIYTYDPSMAYIASKTPTAVTQPVPNIMSFLSTPTQVATPQGNYGAGRFLNSGLLPLNFGLPNDTTGSNS